MIQRCAIAVLILAVCGFVIAAEPSRLPRAAPQAVGMDGAKLARIDQEVADKLAAGHLPGCVVLVACEGKTAFLNAYGHKRLVPEREPMTTDTVFDLASLTKPVATATSILLLVERGKLRLADPVAKHIPEFAGEGKDKISVEQLLTHQGGMIADNDLADYAEGPERAWQRIVHLRPVAEPGKRFIYSDVGFIVLGELVHRLSGQDVHEFTKAGLFGPLGLRETTFLPDESLRRRSAPTEQRAGRWLQGEVHDPRAAKLGGVAGHAGLFSTAEDLAVYAQMLLDRGRWGAANVLSPATVATMTAPRTLSGGGIRSLGWDMRTGYSSNRGELMSEQAVGHGGFTGTSLWIDPKLRLIVIFLSNRVHPDGKGVVNPLAGRIGTLAAAALRAQ